MTRSYAMTDRRNDRWLARLALLFVVLFLTLAPLLSAQPAHTDSATKPTPRVCRQSACAKVRDSLLNESQKRDALQRIEHSLDSIRRDEARRAVRPAERETAADGTVAYLLRTVDGAPVMSDSQYTADTTAIVRGLYKWKGPGKSWALVPLAMIGGSMDRDRGGYQSSYATMDKRAHAAAFGALALTVDERTFAWRGVITAVIVGAAWEVGQMRPSGFPAPHRGQTLGKFDPRDLVADGVGAIVSVGARAAWRAIR